MLLCLTLSTIDVVENQRSPFFSEGKVNVFSKKRNVLSNQRLRPYLAVGRQLNVAIGQHCVASG